MPMHAAQNLRALADAIEAADVGALEQLEAAERALPHRGRPFVLALIDERRRVLAEDA